MNTFIRQKERQNDKNKEKIQQNQLCQTISTKLLIHSNDIRMSWAEHVAYAIYCNHLQNNSRRNVTKTNPRAAS